MAKVASAVRSRRGINRLSDRGVRAFLAQVAAGTATQKKIADGAGLYITTTKIGTPVWRLKYRLGGKERVLSIGQYPEVTLEGARAEREAARAHIRAGRDPVARRQLQRVAAAVADDATFGKVAADWLAHRKPDWSAIHSSRSKLALERDVLPLLGKLPIASIEPAMVARAIERITKRGAIDTAGKVLQHISSIFQYGRARGFLTENPATPVRELLPRKRQHSQRPAFLDFEPLGDLLRRAELAPISPSVRMAHRLTAFSASRVGPIISAEWTEFDLDGEHPEWRIPRRKQKMKDRKHDHRVLLGPTIAGELRKWRAATGGKGFLFPSPSGRAHITHEALEKCYRVTLGLAGKHAPHGWRSSFSTLARDAGHSRDVVELALDHIADTEVVRAYDRGERLAERRKLFAWWDAQLAEAQANL